MGPYLHKDAGGRGVGGGGYRNLRCSRLHVAARSGPRGAHGREVSHYAAFMAFPAARRAPVWAAVDASTLLAGGGHLAAWARDLAAAMLCPACGAVAAAAILSVSAPATGRGAARRHVGPDDLAGVTGGGFLGPAQLDRLIQGQVANGAQFLYHVRVPEADHNTVPD